MVERLHRRDDEGKEGRLDTHEGQGKRRSRGYVRGRTGNC